MDSLNDAEEDNTGETTDDTDETCQATVTMFNHLNLFCRKIFV